MEYEFECLADKGIQGGDFSEKFIKKYGGSQPYLNLFKPIPILDTEGVP